MELVKNTLGTVKINDATFRKSSSHASGIALQAAFANADAWQGHRYQIFAMFCNLVLNDFPHNKGIITNYHRKEQECLKMKFFFRISACK